MSRACTDRALLLCAILALAGCHDKDGRVTASAWNTAERKCAANGGLNHLWTQPEKPTGYRVYAVCGNDMRAEFYSSQDAR